LGQELLHNIPRGVVCKGLGRRELDIAARGDVEKAIEDNRPDVVINAAAYTAVDKAESEPAKAWRVNVEGAENLALECARASVRLIHISTDYVFDGNSSHPYTPESPANPLGEYARSKHAGEEAVLAAAPDAVIIRSGWIYSNFASNFVKTMLRLMQEREQLGVVSDQTGAPTWARGLAQLCWSASTNSRARGIYHWSDAGECSWFQFAVAIYEEASKMGLLNNSVVLKPISTADYAAAAPRPAYTVLDTSLAQETFSLKTIPWRQQLCSMLVELEASRHA
jgi:dTDP-4-dehydrorhamnose reductase